MPRLARAKKSMRIGFLATFFAMTLNACLSGQLRAINSEEDNSVGSSGATVAIDEGFQTSAGGASVYEAMRDKLSEADANAQAPLTGGIERTAELNEAYLARQAIAALESRHARLASQTRRASVSDRSQRADRPESPVLPSDGISPKTNIPSSAFDSRLIEEMFRGSAAVSAPAATRQGESFPVYLRVSPSTLASVINSLKEEFPNNQRVKGRQGVKFTKRMIATVSGFGFEILPREGQLQALSSEEDTTWTWQVKAIDAGSRTLTFILSGTLIVEGKEVARNFYLYEQKINVEVAAFDSVVFIERHWEKILTAIVVPAVGALWAVFSRSNGNGPKSTGTPYARPSRRRLG